jgi:hypothetical protein
VRQILQAQGGDLMLRDHWHRRSPNRLPDVVWNATVHRVRSEFEEMPCLRVTLEQARLLFGLPSQTSGWVLSRLASDGFLMQTGAGEYVRRKTTP